MRVVEVIGDFKIGRTSRKYILINCKGEYEKHAHFENLKGARSCLEFKEKRIKPKNPYFRKALIRLVGEEEFLTYGEVKTKQKYKNNYHH